VLLLMLIPLFLALRSIHSFPTRRSSDLSAEAPGRVSDAQRGLRALRSADGSDHPVPLRFPRPARGDREGHRRCRRRPRLTGRAPPPDRGSPVVHGVARRTPPGPGAPVRTSLQRGLLRAEGVSGADLWMGPRAGRAARGGPSRTQGRPSRPPVEAPRHADEATAAHDDLTRVAAAAELLPPARGVPVPTGLGV